MADNNIPTGVQMTTKECQNLIIKEESWTHCLSFSYMYMHVKKITFQDTSSLMCTFFNYTFSTCSNALADTNSLADVKQTGNAIYWSQIDTMVIVFESKMLKLRLKFVDNAHLENY